MIVPLILKRLGNLLKRYFPTEDETLKILANVEKNKILKHKLDTYCKIIVGTSVVIWAIGGIAMFIFFMEMLSNKYGDNSPLLVTPLVLLLTSMVITFEIGVSVGWLVFKIKNPSIDSKLFHIYATYFTGNSPIFTMNKANWIKINKKIVRFSISLFISTLVLIFYLQLQN